MEAGGPNGPITLRAYVPEYKGDSGSLRYDVTRVCVPYSPPPPPIWSPLLFPLGPRHRDVSDARLSFLFKCTPLQTKHDGSREPRVIHDEAAKSTTRPKRRVRAGKLALNVTTLPYGLFPSLERDERKYSYYLRNTCALRSSRSRSLDTEKRRRWRASFVASSSRAGISRCSNSNSVFASVSIRSLVDANFQR